VQDFEKLGLFYIGRSAEAAAPGGDRPLILYDAKDLVTHAVVVGMTGSGKTGLGIVLLEEAAIDGIPSIVIDPKGDLSNLLLTFPQLAPADFAPWVNEDDARRKGMTAEAYAADQAALWRKGLADWGEDGARVERLRKAADCTVYTPGSESGLPVSILRSFAAPDPAVAADPELFRARVATTATSLLGLIGADTDPIRSREHILLSTLLDQAWKQGKSLDIASLIQAIQAPPVARVGVMDLETFFPSKDRFGLAMALNNLLASPGFEAWMAGDPLDIGTLLHRADGRPRVSIFSIAHLGDAERMFFVSLLLNQTVGWMRTQAGTTSLRALVYMDEIFGYFPPVANPPSKLPLLSLVKQARAFGVGIVLATQNPVDLDYKALANTGTWFVGRLQTERDKARVLDGLEGASAAAGQAFDRERIDRTLSGLRSRVFLMNNVHEQAPVLLETRWTLSYLRGPLSRDEIKHLMDSQRPAPAAAAPAAGAAVAPAPAAPGPAAPQAAPAPGGEPPVLPPDVPQFFVPPRDVPAPFVYRPVVIGDAEVRYSQPSGGVEATRAVTVVTPLTDGPIPVDWAKASEAEFVAEDLEKSPAGGARFDALPPAASKPRNYDAWKKAFSSWIYSSQALALYRSANFEVVSNPGESERDFRIRLQQISRERRDEEVGRLRQSYADRLASLQERLRRAQQVVERESQQVGQQTLQTAISVGATILGAFLGRKAVSMTTVGRATTAARGVGRTMRETQDVGRARETVQAVQDQIAQLEAQLQEETAALEKKLDPGLEALETIKLKPKKTDISVRLVGLGWMPQGR
jgi:hypothetical protein